MTYELVDFCKERFDTAIRAADDEDSDDDDAGDDNQLYWSRLSIFFIPVYYALNSFIQ